MPSRWFERQFAFDVPNSLFATIVERVRGTPARVEERVRGVPTATPMRLIDLVLFVAEHDDS